MSYREEIVDFAALHDRVEDCAQRHYPLGAYATDTHIRYLFLDRRGIYALTASRADGDVLVSSAARYPLFDWDEREMRDQHGVLLRAHPDPRPLFLDGTHPIDALTAQGPGVSIIVVGPVHAGVIEPGRFTISSGGETVVHLDAQFSFSHRGVERALEGMDALDAATRVARICGGCSAAHSWGYARALETLADVACDEPAHLARLVFAEMERIYNHLFDLASMSAGAGYGRGQTQGLELKEQALRLCAAASGHRYLFDAIVPGGVRAGVLNDRVVLRKKLRALDAASTHFARELLKKRSALRRFRGAGVVSSDLARRFGTAGPTRRASSGELDVRCYAPYGAYRTYAPRPARAEAGDAEARAIVKAAELSESFRLIDRALDELGEVEIGSPRHVAVQSGTVSTITEGARGAETISVTCDAQGRLTRMHLISASYRNWPVVARAMEGNIVPDFPLVNKSFNLCYACMDR